MDKEAPVVLMRVWAESEASVIKSLLESYSIPSHYSSGLTNRLYAGLEDHAPGRIRIFVPAAFERQARDILEGHRHQQMPPDPADE